MRARHLLAACPLACLAACFSPPPGGPDREGPRIALTVLNGQGRPIFDSIEGPNDTGDLCAIVPDFPSTPASLALSIGDPGGIARVVVRAGFGEIIDSSVAPAPAATVTNTMDTATDTDVSVIDFTPSPDGRVLTGALVVLDVRADSAPISLRIAADDISRNRTTLAQVDIRRGGDAAACRGTR